MLSRERGKHCLRQDSWKPHQPIWPSEYPWPATKRWERNTRQDGELHPFKTGCMLLYSTMASNSICSQDGMTLDFCLLLLATVGPRPWFMRCWELNPGICVCEPATLTTELRLQPTSSGFFTLSEPSTDFITEYQPPSRKESRLWRAPGTEHLMFPVSQNLQATEGQDTNTRDYFRQPRALGTEQ